MRSAIKVTVPALKKWGLKAHHLSQWIPHAADWLSVQYLYLKYRNREVSTNKSGECAVGISELFITLIIWSGSQSLRESVCLSIKLMKQGVSY